jgi:hypothetical protein
VALTTHPHLSAEIMKGKGYTSTQPLVLRGPVIGRTFTFTFKILAQNCLSHSEGGIDTDNFGPNLYLYKYPSNHFPVIFPDYTTYED